MIKMIKKELITQTAQKLWNTYHERNPYKLCDLLGIRYDFMALGDDPESIQACVVKNSRCYAAIINSDISRVKQYYALFHEVSHIELGHADQLGACTCNNLFSSRETSVMEIEANEFVAEYYMDTKETLYVLRETNDFFQTASIMHVPPAIMDYKYRMLKYYELVSRECPIQTRSDCMKNLDCGDEWDLPEYFDS
ncbi:MAG: ImmA/IrrE family metallo-endopeptidase [Lachnospiraceae bacterium]|nr:ImmA/IrrE family metallo-endopeptidase [Lachnospiraceae bacterium]